MTDYAALLASGGIPEEKVLELGLTEEQLGEEKFGELVADLETPSTRHRVVSFLQQREQEVVTKRMLHF